MKALGFEGSPQEIHDLITINGMNLSDYISAPPAPMKIRWLVLPIVFAVLVLFVIIVGQVTYPAFSAKCLSVSIILQLLCIIWLVSAIQLKFESVTVTVVVSVSCLVLLAVVAGLMTITDALKIAQALKGS